MVILNYMGEKHELLTEAEEQGASDVKRLVMCYRCGYCGQPTDSQGNIMSLDEIKELGDLVNWGDAERTQGRCCG